MSAVSDEAVRRELGRILSSPDFEVSERNRRFLSHVVEETLAGRADRIKAYSIAVGVFGRRDDFDPLQDSIVRIEAARLRRGLEHYYLKHGDAAGLRLSIPKGTYVPSFRVGGEDGDAPAHHAWVPTSRSLHELEPRLTVENFQQEGRHDDCPNIGRTLTRNLISALTKFSEIFVYGPDTMDGQAETEGHSGRATARIVDYRLLGAVTITSDTLHAEILMQRSSDGRFIWAQNIERRLECDREPSRVAGLCAQIAAHTAQAIALRDGILDTEARDAGADAPKHFAGYQKLRDFHDYWRSLDPALFEPLRRDLESAIASDPQFAAAHACLSILYSNAARFGYDPGAGCDAPLDRALELARTAIHLAPTSSRAYHARAVAEWFLGMPQQSLDTLQSARSLNPNDPELVAELGLRCAMRMDWETGVPLIEEAYRHNPLQPGHYRTGLFLYHFAQGRPARALREIRAAGAPQIAHVHLAAAAALSELGRMDEARQSLDLSERLSPELRLRMNRDLAFRQLHPALSQMIETAVRRIGRD